LHQVGTSSLLISMMHGHTYIKVYIVVFDWNLKLLFSLKYVIVELCICWFCEDL